MNPSAFDIPPKINGHTGPPASAGVVERNNANDDHSGGLKGLLAAVVSFFPHLKNSRESSTLMVGDLLAAIRDDRWATEITRIREIWRNTPGTIEAKKQAVRREKEALPLVTWAGVFTARNKEGLLRASGIYCADLDHLDDVVGVRAKLESDIHVIAVIASPTGTGLKVLFLVNPDAIARDPVATFHAVESYVRITYNLQIDPSCKDICRACFVSFDPALRINTRALPLAVAQQETTSKPSADLNTGKYTGDVAPLILPSNAGISIADSAEQIFSRIAPTNTLFHRGGRVHELVSLDGSPVVLSPVTPAQFRSRLEAYGPVFVHRADDHGESILKECLCPKETAEALLETKAAGAMLPHIRQLLAAPVLTLVGDELLTLRHGYHPQCGGIYVTSKSVVLPVPVSSAAENLAALARHYNFESPGDRSRALASFISPTLLFGGFLLDRMPYDFWEGDASQSGKGLWLNMRAAIYGERLQMVVPKSKGVGSTDESIGEAMIRGRPFFCVDNVRGQLDSVLLEVAATADGSIPVRVAYKGEVLVDPSRFVIGLTSNGIETTEDLLNRLNVVRIRKQPRDYPFPDYCGLGLLEWVRKNQPFYLGCVHSIVRDWVINGKKQTNESRHDFTGWTRKMDYIVQHYFGAAPLMDGFDEVRTRVSNPAVTWLRKVALQLRDENRFGESFSAHALAEFSAAHGIPPPGFRSDASPHDLARLIGILLKPLFGTGDRVVLDGVAIHRAVTRRDRGSSGGDKEAKVYMFQAHGVGGAHQAAPS